MNEEVARGGRGVDGKSEVDMSVGIVIRLSGDPEVRA